MSIARGHKPRAIYENLAKYIALLPCTVLNVCMLLHCIICRNVRDTGTAGRPPIHLDIEQLTYFIGNLDSA